MPVVLPRPLPALGGKLFHYRPVFAVRLISPRIDLVLDGMLDTGADETLFQEQRRFPLAST
jgi:hypothetical protein